MDLESILEDLRQFRDKRDWPKFHTPKNLAISIAIEACELLELFQWTRDFEEEKNVLENKRLKSKKKLRIFSFICFFCAI
ncbi:MAG: nucleotide pyrophosphohydrolase [Archaeoglobales archaeon]|nr:nucleotide pyrophosphohydrolase [Archaeoglobales archaeon]